MQLHADKSKLNVDNGKKNQNKEDESKLNLKLKKKNKEFIDVSETKKRKVTSSPNEDANQSTSTKKSPKKLTVKEARLIKNSHVLKKFTNLLKTGIIIQMQVES